MSGRASSARLAWYRRATERARLALARGDVVEHGACLGAVETLVFAGWDGDWIRGRGRPVGDVAAVGVVAVNGRRVDFAAGEPRPD